MPVMLFSLEEIMALKLSPYVVEATERFLYFSAEFKQRFYDEYQEGKSHSQLLAARSVTHCRWTLF